MTGLLKHKKVDVDTFEQCEQRQAQYTHHTLTRSSSSSSSSWDGVFVAWLRGGEMRTVAEACNATSVRMSVERRDVQNNHRSRWSSPQWRV